MRQENDKARCVSQMQRAFFVAALRRLTLAAAATLKRSATRSAEFAKPLSGQEARWLAARKPQRLECRRSGRLGQEA